MSVCVSFYIPACIYFATHVCYVFVMFCYIFRRDIMSSIFDVISILICDGMLGL